MIYEHALREAFSVRTAFKRFKDDQFLTTVYYDDSAIPDALKTPPTDYVFTYYFLCGAQRVFTSWNSQDVAGLTLLDIQVRLVVIQQRVGVLELLLACPRMIMHQKCVEEP